MFWISVAVAAAICVPVMALKGASMLAATPELGRNDRGELTSCPAKPNCVCSQDSSPSHSIEPLEVRSNRADVIEVVCSVCTALPGSRLVVQEDDYARFEIRSRLFRFVDDVEILWDPIDYQLHFRSASRVGHSDMGVNRKRIEAVKRELSERLNRPD